MAAARRLLTVAVLAVVLAGTASCVDTSGPVTPPEPSTVVSDSASPAATPTDATSAAAAGNFPASARAYAEAVLAAWRAGTIARIAELTTPGVQLQLQTTKAIDGAWTFVSCQGAAGSSYCQFVNGDGDVTTLRLNNQLLARAHATTEVKLDLTTYSNNAVEYVKAFVEGWRNDNERRMAALASQAEVDYITHDVPPNTYSTCATLTSGVANVRVYNTSGLNYTLTVNVAALGGRHAITGHAATPALCP